MIEFITTPMIAAALIPAVIMLAVYTFVWLDD